VLPARIDLYDRERARPVPVARYSPPAPSRGWILFSVGFGGGRDGYGYLARSWASHGFGVLVIEHVGSNLAVLKRLRRPTCGQAELAKRVGRAVAEPEELLQRPRDLKYVLESQAIQPPYGLAGHSFGPQHTGGSRSGSALTAGWPRLDHWGPAGGPRGHFLLAPGQLEGYSRLRLPL